MEKMQMTKREIVEDQLKIIKKGAAEIIGEEQLITKLNQYIDTQKPLVVKLGLDPSAPDIHIGHGVVLRKLKQIQDCGHHITLIIGDFTGRIGDPTGKSKARKQLTEEQVLENGKTYADQVFKILDPDKTTLAYNSHWLGKLDFSQVIELSAKYTLARMLEREDFKNRFDQSLPISLHELFYPLMQGYDSVAIEADIELGGTDQRFNILMGRTLQRAYGKSEQVAILMPLLEGLDGSEKMSKSLGNTIGIDESPKDMFRKTMKVPDELVIKYFELATDIHPDEIDVLKSELEGGIVNPKDIKLKLAREITRLYHDEEAASEAEIHFLNVFSKGQFPDDMARLAIIGEWLSDEGVDLVKLLVSKNIVASGREVKRLIQQGGIKLNHEALNHSVVKLVVAGDVLQIGKRVFFEFE